MRILVNRKVRALFGQITLCLLIFIILSIILILSEPAGTVLRAEEITPGRWRTVMSIAVCAVSIGIAVLAICCRYFREQDRVMEDAVIRIREFVAGDREARIECDEEGELYRLFHEINSLAAILNAKAESEEESRKFLRNTISDISHQLKTPLAALNIYNGIMQTEAGANDPAAIKEFTDLSEQELDRIETLVQNLLKITKFDAGSVVMEKRTENISEMMEDVKKHFAFRAEQEGKEIVLSGSDSLSFLCDRNWIVEAVSNIVKNALDHTENGDRILIEWRESASAVRIAIVDNGTGIHPEDLHHIFKRFYRSRYSKDTQGIGLGLPLSKSVTEAHNGTIEVDSRLGEGTTFIMNFLVFPTKL
ncbi:MAG: HAMP domain-containing histidine kinase [Lachnospiraceae bacterium]|nr:HAMP domain-containing histidine kinase [Lachnospiraceae bacterium]